MRYIDDEGKRLEELYSYHILDSLSEKDYEDITALASLICDVPIALISFVDKDRQWFKSNRGLEATETLREHSFCAHAIKTPDSAFAVQDSRLDERFKDNPLVTGSPNIVFYAGIPLVSPNGHGLGTVCVIDSKPRVLTPKQIGGLQILAGQVMSLLELRRANNTLSVENTKLDSSLVAGIDKIKKQNEQLEKMNKELQAFAYISSHDLQEPLRKIQTFTTLIEQRESGNLSDAGKEYFGKIGKSSARMSALIQDLLAYSRTATAKKVYDTVVLKNVFDDVVRDFDDVLEYNATIRLLNNGMLHVISFQFRQVLYNLISNSVKFSRNGVPSQIDVDFKQGSGADFNCNMLTAEDEYYMVSVKDNGVGFEDKYKDKIFELFQRLETEELQTGTGIGLTIVKKIVDNHNGYIEVESEVHKGTVFTIYIPAAPVLVGV